MKIESYLKEQGVYFVEHDHAPAYTAQEVAAQEHVSGNMMAKPVLVRADDGYVMCVVPATFQVDLDKVSRAVKARVVRLAKEEEMAQKFPDAEMGAAPPFGNIYNVRTLMDARLRNHEEICFRAGSHKRAIKMKVADYIFITRPEIEDVSAQA